MAAHRRLQPTPSSSVVAQLKLAEEDHMDGKSLLIGVLLVAVVVLGYLFWDREHNTIFKAPGVEIKKS